MLTVARSADATAAADSHAAGDGAESALPQHVVTVSVQILGSSRRATAGASELLPPTTVAAEPAMTPVDFANCLVFLPFGFHVGFDTVLRWESHALDPLVPFSEQPLGSWRMKLDGRERLVLMVPPGTCLRSDSDTPDYDIDCRAEDTLADLDPLQASLSYNRSLHPGCTRPETFIPWLRSCTTLAEDVGIVDLGSGDGRLCLALKEAFPKACVRGVECQLSFVEEARELTRDVHFVHGLAEVEAAKCLTDQVFICVSHNFDASARDAVITAVSRLPNARYLVMGQESICNARCKIEPSACCCFELIDATKIHTDWGNALAPFSIYRKMRSLEAVRAEARARQHAQAGADHKRKRR